MRKSVYQQKVNQSLPNLSINKSSLILSKNISKKNLQQIQQSEDKQNKQNKQNLILQKSKNELNSLMKYAQLPKHLLDKKKKYYHHDNKYKFTQQNQNNILQYDLQSIIGKFIKQRQKHDLIVINLRKNYTLQNKYRKMMQNYNKNILMPYLNKKINQSHKKKLSIITDDQSNKQTKCPLNLVKNLNQHSSNLKDDLKILKKQPALTQEINVNQMNFFTKNSILILEMKNLNKQLKYYVNKLKQYINENSHQIINNMSNDNNSLKNRSILSSFTNINFQKKKNDKKFQKLQMNHNYQINNIKNSQKKQKNNNRYFKQYVKLSQQSFDYLQYYLKSNCQTPQNQPSLQYSQNYGQINRKSLNIDSLNMRINMKYSQELNNKNNLIINYNRNEIQSVLRKSQNIEKKIILTVLKQHFYCFQVIYNPQQIINRILLAYSLNPLNDFQFINQNVYTKMRKLILNQNLNKNSKDFLIQYFFLDEEQLCQEQFYILLISIFKKLQKIINMTTIDTIFQNFKSIFEKNIHSYQPSSINKQKQNKNKNKKQQKKLQKIDKNSLSSTITSQQFQKQQNISHKQSLIQIKSHNKLPKQNKKTITKQQFKNYLVNDPIFLWNQIVQLIFIA